MGVSVIYSYIHSSIKVSSMQEFYKLKTVNFSTFYHIIISKLDVKIKLTPTRRKIYKLSVNLKKKTLDGPV